MTNMTEKEGQMEEREGGWEGGNTQINTLMSCIAGQASTYIDITFVDNSPFLLYPVLNASRGYIKLQPKVHGLLI